MRFTVAFVVAAAALFTADAAKINTRRRLGNNNNKNNAATQERNLSSHSGKGKGKGKGYDSTSPTEDSALARAEVDGLNRGQICAAGQARASVLEMILPLNMADSSGKGKGGKSGKVSKSISMHACMHSFVEHIGSAKVESSEILECWHRSNAIDASKT